MNGVVSTVIRPRDVRRVCVRGPIAFAFAFVYSCLGAVTTALA